MIFNCCLFINLFLIGVTIGQSFDYYQQPIVVTKFGTIQGIRKNFSGHFYEEFLGIRYGQIPKRFRYSIVNNDHWEGTLKANAFGPSCTQSMSPNTSEDCLYINIWRPVINQSSTNTSLLPVLLWVHGSGYQSGSGANNPGDIIAGSGPVIVTSINYRLGAFGYAFGDIDEIQGNQGISDVITALIWTRDNIAAFGGDPNRVTLGGHSAGSMIGSIFPVLPTVDHSLYSQLFILSGVSVNPMFIEDTTVGLAKTKLLATKVGCGPVAEGPLTLEVIECLQTVDASIILANNQQDDIKVIGGAEVAAFIPVYGTPLIPKPLIELFRSASNSNNSQLSLINGISKDEAATFWGNLRPKTRSEGWEMAWSKLSFIKKDLTANEMQPFYDYYFNNTIDGDERSLRTALTNFMDDYSFRCTSLMLSEVYSTRYTVHFAEFDYILDKYGPDARPDGPRHGDAVELFFGDPFRSTRKTTKRPGTYSERDAETSKRLIKLLIDFLKGDGLTDWPKVNLDKHNPEIEPIIRKIDYQDSSFAYDKQTICIQWSKLFNYSPVN